MKKILAILLAASMLACISACSDDNSDTGGSGNVDSGSESAGDKGTDNVNVSGGVGEARDFDAFPHPVVVKDDEMRVGFIHNSTTNEDTARMLTQMKIECEHRGWTLVDGEYENMTDFRDTWEVLLNQNINALVIGVTDNFESYSDLVEESRSSGIGIYCVDNTPIEGVICNTFLPLGVCTAEMMYKIGSDFNWDFNFCVMTVDAVASHAERMCVVEALGEVFPNVTELARDGSPVIGESALLGYDIAQAWIQQFGDELDVIFTSFQMIGLNSAEAIIQNGDPTGEKTMVAFVDQGPSSWTYLRNNTPVKYVYATPFELIYHTTCEIIDQIQIQGMAPGDEGCTLATSAQQLYVDGTLLTSENVPAVGSSIHSAFSYYDESDTDAWYNWYTEGGTQITMVTE